MRSRCLNPNSNFFPHYGGRGIVVCDDWSSFTTFKRWATRSGYEEGLQLDRIDNDGPYSPENCRWTTARVNARNRRSNIPVTAYGETKILIEWAEDPRCQVKEMTFRKRIRSGWDPERALTQPSRNHATFTNTNPKGNQ